MASNTPVKKSKKIKFSTRKFLNRPDSLAAISVSYEDFPEYEWDSGCDVTFRISSGMDELSFYNYKDIKKISVMLSTFIAKVEALK